VLIRYVNLRLSSFLILFFCWLIHCEFICSGAC
jgi:hypothetical protein